MWKPPHGKRKQGRPRITWRRTFMEDLKAVNVSWDEAENIMCSGILMLSENVSHFGYLVYVFMFMFNRNYVVFITVLIKV